VAGEYADLDCGHVARVERPDEVVALIRDFLGRPPVGVRP
jgi:hypothetical protein